MKYADYFRQLAQRCRVLSKTAVEPEVIEQMRVWTVDFADEADEAEHRGVERGPLARTLRESDGLAGHAVRALTASSQ